MKAAFPCFFLLLSSLSLHAAPPALTLKRVCDGQFHAPTEVANAGDGSGRLFICDQPGKIFIFKRGMLQPEPFLDLGASGLNRVFYYDPAKSEVPTGYSERGLLGLAFHPDFANPSAPGHRRFYVNYTSATAPTGHPSTPQNCVTVVSEFRVLETDANKADSASERILLTYGQPQSNHNGGQLAFGPDGFLYVGSGDGGGAYDNAVGHTGGTSTTTPGLVSGTLGNGQDKTRLLGKILRIDPLGSDAPGGQYGIPTDNPFAASAGGERKEIYALGLRNPWRFSFDRPPTGPVRLICADVGQYDVEEINLVTSGGNYGWRVKEGSVDVDITTPYGGGPLIPPVAEYAHPGASLPGTETLQKLGSSITGGYVYRGSAIPGLQGKYLFGDYAVNGIGAGGGVLLVMEETAGAFSLSQIAPLNPLPATARIYTFGVDESGEIYVGVKTTAGVMALSGGRPAGILYKVVPPAEVQVHLPASKDNTLYETVGASRSNGKGAYLFAGKTDSQADLKLRRAALRFDIASLPAGVPLTSATVRLGLSRQVAQDFPMTLHRLTADWGEGTSNAGTPGGAGVAATTNDATWTHRFHNTVPWATPGGDYVPSPSATYLVGSQLADPFPAWTGPALLQDVQAWVASPSTNFGWLLIGDETQAASAQRFYSREDSNADNRPRLTLSYAAPIQPGPFQTWLSTYFPGSPIGFYLDEEADPDGDGVTHLQEYAYGLNPLEEDLESGFTLSTEEDGNGSLQAVMTFRRDSAATDLTYQLQTSTDLVSWANIATSTGGTGPVGSEGGVILSDTVQTGTIRLVTVRETLAPPAKTRRFVRVHVQRSF